MTAAEKVPTKAAIIGGFATIYLVWGSTYLGIRVAVETLPPFLMAGARFLVAGLLIATFLAVTRGFKTTPRQWLDSAIVGALLLLGGNGLVSWAEQKIPSGSATRVVSLGPLFIVLLDWAVAAFGADQSRGTRPSLAIFAGVGLGITGLAVLVGPSLGLGATQLDPWRIGGLVLACLSWSAGSLYSRYARNSAEPYTASAMQMLTGCGWLFLVSIALGEPQHFNVAAVSGRSLFAWAYLVVAGSLVGFTTFVWLVKHSAPARVATYAYVNPIVAVFLGWLIAREPVGPRLLVASGIIIAGVALITAVRNRKAPAQPAAAAAGQATPAEATVTARPAAIAGRDR